VDNKVLSPACKSTGGTVTVWLTGRVPPEVEPPPELVVPPPPIPPVGVVDDVSELPPLLGAALRLEEPPPPDAARLEPDVAELPPAAAVPAEAPVFEFGEEELEPVLLFFPPGWMALAAIGMALALATGLSRALR
jgi:hypothetical protein